MLNLLRNQVREEMAVAVRVRAPMWLVDALASALGELAGLSVHQHDPVELAGLESRVRGALTTWSSWKRSQGLAAA